MRVRRMVHRMGYRYRLHNKKLPGKPDLVLARHKKVILIHGCFWHQHGVCRPLAVPQQNNPDFWREKFSDNVAPDQRNLQQLKVSPAWEFLVVWESRDEGRWNLRIETPGISSPTLVNYLRHAHRRNTVDEHRAKMVAEALGGEPWHSGGGISIVFFRKASGIVVISDDMVCEYPSMGDFEAGRATSKVLLAS